MSETLKKDLYASFVKAILNNTLKDSHSVLLPELLSGGENASNVLLNSLENFQKQVENENNFIQYGDLNDVELEVSNEMIQRFVVQNPQMVLEKLQEGICRAVYYKNDGTAREMWCTRNKDILQGEGQDSKTVRTEEEIQQERRKQVSEGMFKVYDISAKGWRRLNIEQLVVEGTIPFISFQIDKPLWAEIIQTFKELPELNNQTYDIKTLSLTEERTIASVPLVDYSLQGLYNTLLADYMTENSPINIAMSLTLKEKPEIACSLLNSKVVRAVFVKRDGSKRVMWCTRIPQILQDNNEELKSSEEKSIEIAQFEVYDLEAEGMRKLNINNLYVADNENPFMAFDYNDKAWYQIFKGEKQAEDVFQENKSSEVDNYLSGNLSEFTYTGFVFDSGDKVNIPESLEINNILQSFEQNTTNSVEQGTSSESQEGTNDSDVLTSEDAIKVFDELLSMEKIIPNSMDIEYDLAYDFAKRRLLEVSTHKFRNVVSVDDEKKVVIISFLNTIYFGYTSRGIYGVFKHNNKIAVFSDKISKLSLVETNAHVVTEYLSLKYGILDSEAQSDLFYLIRHLALLQAKIKENYPRRLKLSLINVSIQKDPLLLEKYKRIQAGCQLGKSLPPRHRLRQTEKRKIVIMPNGCIRIEMKDFVVILGEAKAFYQASPSDNFVEIVKLPKRSSINNEVNSLLDGVKNYLNQEVSPNTANEFNEFTTLYISRGLDMRMKDSYFEKIQSYINSPNR